MTARKRLAIKDGDDGTVRRTTTIAADVSEKLEALAKKEHVSVSWLMARAIRELVDRES